MGELTGAMYDASVVHSTLPLVPGLVERLERGIDVLDVGCGYGHAANLVGQAFPNSTVTGYDIDADGIAAARAEAEALGLTNVRFAVKDAAGLDEPAAFDLVTSFFAIHDLAQPTRTLAAIARALRPGGSFLMLEAAMSSELAEVLLAAGRHQHAEQASSEAARLYALKGNIVSAVQVPLPPGSVLSPRRTRPLLRSC